MYESPVITSASIVWNAMTGLSRWAELLAYLSVACLCVWTATTVQRSRCQRFSQGPPSIGYRRRRRLWLACAILLAMLGITLRAGWIDDVVANVRLLAWTEGWYRQRWDVQWPVVGVLSAAAVCLIILACRPRREWYPRDRWTLVAVFGLLSLILIRSVSLHFVDAVLYHDIAHVSVGRWVEMTMISVIAGSALWTMRCRRTQRRQLKALSLQACSSANGTMRGERSAR